MTLRLVVDDLLTFVDQSLSHLHQLSSLEVPIPIAHFTWLIGDACHLKELHGV